MSALVLRPLQHRICPKCGQAHSDSKSWCSSCTREYNAAYRKANSEKLKEAKAAHYQGNKAEYIARSKRWKSENPAKVALCSQGYGLHVHNNLQVIPASDNLKKGSRHVCA